MDTKRLILNVSFVLVLFFAWKLTLNQIGKRHPAWLHPATQPAAVEAAATTRPATVASTQPAAVATHAPAEPATTAPAVVATPATTAPAAVAAAGLHVEDDAAAATVSLGSGVHADAAFPIGLAIDPRGAGLNSVTLNDFFKTAKDPSAYQFQIPAVESPADTRPLATRAVTVDGHEVDLTDARWHASAVSAAAATFTTRILDGARPVLELTKTFKLQHRDAADASGGYDVAVAQQFRNLTAAPLAVSASYNGPLAPAPENSRSEDRRFVTGFDEGDQVVKTDDTFVNELSKAKATVKDLAVTRPLPLLWVGTCNSYFDAIVRPDAAGGATATPMRVAAAPAVGLDDTTHDAAFNFNTNAVTLGAGATVPFDFHAFMGPKQRALLKNNYYAAFPRVYSSTLVYVSKWCGLLTFGWLIDTLYFILRCFHFVFRDWGLAIIGLVVLVRTCLHPITKRSQIQMMGMSKMGPEIERLKKKYGDDKDGLNKAMMTVYKEQGMAPILGCLPMLLQTPIWLALWNALQSTFEIRQAGFLRFGHAHLTWISDLSQPDALVSFANPLSLPFGMTMHSINVLPVLLAGVFFLQQMMMPKPANMTPEQEQQRKMTRWMSLMYPIFFYVSPSGLNLYILTSTSIGIVESKIVRKHIRERDEAEKAGRIIVDAGPVRPVKRIDAGPKKEPPKRTGFWAEKMADLQAKAEQIMREADRKKGDGRR